MPPPTQSKPPKANVMSVHQSAANPSRITRQSRAATVLLTTAMLAFLVTPASAAEGDIDLGKPSVLSQRGQRLKLAIPYGSGPGERVSAVGIEIVSIEAANGAQAPDLKRFTTSTPERHKLVFITSAERIDAAELTISYRFSGQPGSLQTWQVMVPPALMADSTEISIAPSTSRTASSGRTRRN